jgi:uncharacterized membrane protein (DUF441 family)
MALDHGAVNYFCERICLSEMVICILIIIFAVLGPVVQETINLSPVYTTLNFWYGTDKIGTRTTFLVLGLPI